MATATLLPALLLLLASPRAILADDDGEAKCPDISGYLNHGNCNLLCKPASWTDIALFFLGNYVVHAGTVISRPGQSALGTIVTVAMALLFPSSGVMRALGAMVRHPRTAPTKLQKAARAGALFAIVKKESLRCGAALPVAPPAEDESGEQGNARGHDIAQNADAHFQASSTVEKQAQTTVTERQPSLGHTEGQATLEPQEEPIPLLALNIHGLCTLPKGYDMMILPEDSKFVDDEEDEPVPLVTRLLPDTTILFRRPKRQHLRTSVTCSYNLIKALISIGQLAYTVSTLYRTSTDEIRRYGRQAPGLTVANYAWMSLLNLIGNLLYPEYPSLYLVEPRGTDELQASICAQGQVAEARFALRGAVGRVTDETEELVASQYSQRIKASECSGVVLMYELRHYTRWGLAFYAPLLVSSIPLSVMVIWAVAVGCSGSRLPLGENVPIYQVVIVNLWLLSAAMGGPYVSGFVDSIVEPRPVLNHRAKPSRQALYLGFVSVLHCTMSALVALIAVGIMVHQYGVCVDIS